MATGGQLDLLNNSLIYDYSPNGNTVSPIIGLTKLVLAGYKAKRVEPERASSTLTAKAIRVMASRSSIHRNWV